ncbi:MAG: quinol dehydrogenase ferredoxin subunit NapH [gamma proteobacterium symbiont of Bathyaustriella thionipta]|nr:quinol dehydrogenase ferredoxin subunit NapH [gamma proteobacterium symbiont of Bathyaustriella thionipta]
MNTAAKENKLGPNGKPVRPFVMPKSMRGKLSVWRYLIYRRTLQITILLLFYGTAHWGWNIAETPIIVGNLSASKLLGFIPLADPFASLQIMFTRHMPQNELLIGAAIVLGFYALIGGRVWCSWVCPINMVSDLAAWLRKRLHINDNFRLSKQLRYSVLILTLLLSTITGLAAFEWVSPISMFHRELIFGVGMGWTAILGIFLFDLLVQRDGWCGRICPLGAFYALVGKLALLRIGFDAPTCTHCCECIKVCPEPAVLNFSKAAQQGMIISGECTNCGRCITVCPEDTLQFRYRFKTSTHQPAHSNPRLTTGE